MTRTFLTIIILLVTVVSKSQDISIANEKMNIFYKGIDNPISFAADGVSNKSLIIKANNGTVSKQYGYYTFRSDSIGKAEIIIYKKVQGKLTEIGRRAFSYQSNS